MNTYIAFAKTDFLERISNPYNALSWGLFLFAIAFVYVNLWGTIYSEGDVIRGFSFAQLLTYLIIAQALTFSFSFGRRIERIGKSVRTGEVALLLIKPVSFIMKELAVSASIFLHRFIILFPAALLVIWISQGTVEVSVLSILSGLPILLLGWLINALFVVLLGFSSLWLEQTSSFVFIYSKLIFILGGMLVPIDFYPEFVQNIISYLPFQYIMYNPARALTSVDWLFFIQSVTMQVLWVGVISVVLLTVYRKGIKQIGVNGG